MLKANRHRGFTLIETLVVIAIIGILAGIVLVFFGWGKDKGKGCENSVGMGQLRSAAELYALDHDNAYGPTVSGLCTSGMFQDPTMASYINSIQANAKGNVVKCGTRPRGVEVVHLYQIPLHGL